MNYTVLLMPRARRDRRKLPGNISERVDHAIAELADHPRPPGCLKLTNSDEWRVRVGQYRIRYLIDDDTRTIRITRIGHRRDVYDF